jgi:hypothetical protein
MNIDPIAESVPMGDFKPKTSYTIDDVTREINTIVYENGKRIVCDEWDEELLVESATDMMALYSPQMQDKKVLIVKLSEWKKGKKVEPRPVLKCFICGKMTCRGECDEDTFLGLI